MTTITISLPESLKSFVDSQLAAKGYGNVSEYFRSLLRTAREEEEDVRVERLLMEGLAGESIPVDDKFWRDLDAGHARYKKQSEAKNRKSKKTNREARHPISGP
jgi:antitoxin ParD1/3/4